MEERMKESTREQIKEAFNKTIERWEKIVEDVGYYYDSSCALCDLSIATSGCIEKNCAIALYNKIGGCKHTPYIEFDKDRTPANALAELNFLRNVYIWWMEKEANKILDKVGSGVLGARKEEKKEEWVDVTEEIEWKSYQAHDGTYWVRGYYNGQFVTWLDIEGIHEGTHAPENQIKIERADEMSFRILKKT